MDHLSRKQFDELLRQEPGSLRETDIAFLRSRESYLTPEQRERFKDVLNPAEPVEEAPKKKAK